MKDDVDALWDLREHYFSPEDPKKKEAMILEKMEKILKKKPASDRAVAAYVKGRTLDAGPTYSAQAEDALSRAVKLAPEAVDAWNALGHVFWKKQDLAAAKDCFSAANDVFENSQSLRSLSMLLRKKNNDDSVDFAKRAASIGLEDPESWYALGNALVARYFDRRNGSDLRDAHRAYARAEKLYSERASELDGFKYGNPDLFNNRGHLRKYLEDYGCVSDFDAAHNLDPTLGALDVKDDLLRWTKRVADIVQRKAGLKTKKRQELYAKLKPGKGLASLPVLSDPLAGFLDDDNTADTDENNNDSIPAVVALELRRDGCPDVFLVVVRQNDGDEIPTDQNVSFVCLAVYDADADPLATPGASLLIDRPARFSHDFDLLRITLANRIAVDGVPLKRSLRAVSSCMNK